MGNNNLANVLGFLLSLAVGLLVYTEWKKRKARPCENIFFRVQQCSQHTQTIDSLELIIHTDSVTMDLMEYEYLILWEENQRFSSMLSQIENEPGGHEILQKLWNEQR